MNLDMSQTVITSHVLKRYRERFDEQIVGLNFAEAAGVIKRRLMDARKATEFEAMTIRTTGHCQDNGAVYYIDGDCCFAVKRDRDEGGWKWIITTVLDVEYMKGQSR